MEKQFLILKVMFAYAFTYSIYLQETEVIHSISINKTIFLNKFSLINIKIHLSLEIFVK